MFRSSRALFSQVPCPGLPKCRAPFCLFSHPASALASARSISSASVDRKRKHSVSRSPSPARSSISGNTPGKQNLPRISNEPPAPRRNFSTGLGNARLSRRDPISTKKDGSSDLQSTADGKATATNKAAGTSIRIDSDNLFGSILGSFENMTNKQRSAQPAPKSVRPVTSQSESKSLNSISTKESPPATDPPTIFIHPIKPNPPAVQQQRSQFAKVIADTLRDKQLSATPNYDASCREREIAQKTTSATYTSTIKFYIIGLRKMTKEDYSKTLQKKEKSASGKQLSTPNTAASASSGAGTAQPQMTDEEILTRLEDLVISKDKLKDCGFTVELPSAKELTEATEADKAAGGYELCERCSTRFHPNMAPLSECVFHWARPYTRTQTDLTRVRIYPCCGEEAGASRGCTTSNEHVYHVTAPARLANTIPFVETTEKGPHFPKAVSLDCEMGYTTLGVELIRVTILDYPSNKVLYDTLVKPIGRVIDLNTRFSGVTSLDKNPDGSEVPAFGTARREILSKYLGKHTVLLGHGLENDLASMRIIHTRVVDSSLIYLHEDPRLASLNIRMSLRNLAKKHLDRDIQVRSFDPADKVGHDSWEDAKAAADLITQKLLTIKRLELQYQMFNRILKSDIPPSASASQK
ncbi:hypothetical protein BZA70DRAFT_24982 [Myxozyma melibiosi]|uniref:Exonuclease domain-containing protein n=1 Tax=Myxozyma melibiosi TaxID=54550 RepID=A0ABR1FD39_9ASCO